MKVLGKAFLLVLLFLQMQAKGQGIPALDTTGWLLHPPNTVLMAPSSLKVQVLFMGGKDSVLTLYGMALSKGRNDYVTFVPITPGVADSGYVCISHESIEANSMIGDGGGMTVLKVVRDGDSLRKVGPARAVDFRAVGGTLSNCAGITSPTGRVWTGEEAWRTNNLSLLSSDTADVELAPLGQVPGPGQVYNDIPGDFSGRTLKRFQNMNYMVEVDVVNAKAVRKQYNWGRMQQEGGVVQEDNRTVIISPDAAPCYLPRFVADSADDFSKGRTYAYRQLPGGPGGWKEINNSSIDSMLRFQNIAAREGCALFNRLEWSAIHDGKVYISETGRDDVQSAFRGARNAGAHVARHHLQRAREQYPALATMSDAQVEDSVCYGAFQYHDYYGRILEYDPQTDSIRVFLEGGPLFKDGDAYPGNHLSNPDGLAFLHVNGKSFMLIAEDLIGASMGRIPPPLVSFFCEIYMLDMSIPNPGVMDLKRLAVMPLGAEATGTASTPDGKTVFFNSQHPYTSNPYPYNYSVTLALSGWDSLISAADDPVPTGPLHVWPNPTSSLLYLDRTTSGIVYSLEGKVVRVLDKVRHVSFDNLPSGLYLLWPENGHSVRVIVAH